MPVIRIQRDELRRLGVDEDKFVKDVFNLGADLKDYDEREIRVEFFPDRPDLYTVEGIARAIKGFWGIERSAPRYEVKNGSAAIRVNGSVSDVRPYVVGAVIKNLAVDEVMIKSMMDFQEKLHITVGRKRKKVAIGLHDMDKVDPPFTYTTVSGDFKFQPLGFDREMSVEEILRKHPKGIEYGDIVKGEGKYPIILDSRGNVLSMPPIINGVLTQITERTRNIFVDITGTDLDVLKGVLNIIVSSFADRGAVVESVLVQYPDFEITVPEMKYERIEVKKEYVKRILGDYPGDDSVRDALERMRYDVEIDEKIMVTIPPYRMDILHPVDIVEDIAKGMGYSSFSGKLPQRERISRVEDSIGSKFRQIMLGLGFTEVTTLTISSMKRQYDDMRLEREEYVLIENPITREGDTLRSWLIPSMMEILEKNIHRELPQAIFEVGYVVKDEQEIHGAFLYVSSKANFTMAKSYAEAILRDLGIEGKVEEKEHGSFIDGRCASILFKGEEIGFFGEIHPEVLEKFQIGYPTIGLEINFSKIK